MTNEYTGRRREYSEMKTQWMRQREREKGRESKREKGRERKRVMKRERKKRMAVDIR